jgi:hypothetical protein
VGGLQCDPHLRSSSRAATPTSWCRRDPATGCRSPWIALAPRSTRAVSASSRARSSTTSSARRTGRTWCGRHVQGQQRRGAARDRLRGPCRRDGRPCGEGRGHRRPRGAHRRRARPRHPDDDRDRHRRGSGHRRRRALVGCRRARGRRPRATRNRVFRQNHRFCSDNTLMADRPSSSSAAGGTPSSRGEALHSAPLRPCSYGRWSPGRAWTCQRPA